MGSTLTLAELAPLGSVMLVRQLSHLGPFRLRNGFVAINWPLSFTCSEGQAAIADD